SWPHHRFNYFRLHNWSGYLALFLSILHPAIGRRTWKAFHFTVYVAAVALFIHSLLTDPGLKNAAVDWLDGGKIFVELSLVLLVILTVLRWRYARRKARRRANFLQRTAITSR